MFVMQQQIADTLLVISLKALKSQDLGNTSVPLGSSPASSGGLSQLTTPLWDLVPPQQG